MFSYFLCIRTYNYFRDNFYRNIYSVLFTMKKTHKNIAYKWNAPNTACKMENKTWAFKSTNDWKLVTCQNCLKQRKQKEGK